MKTIIPGKNEEFLIEACERFSKARSAAALTGAGISVNSGIADFRSPGGLWSVFSPEEYASLETFFYEPEKAWQLYREMGKTIIGKQPNIAHRVLAELEEAGSLKGLVTQNVDSLHQMAGSRQVFEIHGDHQHLQCIKCRDLIKAEASHYQSDQIPHCPHCDIPYKPNVVLFGEPVRDFEEIDKFISRCDLLLVIGTSANVYPAASLPEQVKQRGGLVYEFNREQTLSISNYGMHSPITDYFFEGDLSTTMPLFHRSLGTISG